MRTGGTISWLVLIALTLGPSRFAKAEAPVAPTPTASTAAPASEMRHGEIQFEPVANESQVVPTQFQLPAHSFAFEQELMTDMPDDGVSVFNVRFPSPVETPHKNNNTVHCEYYRPTAAGKYPAVIVLHILGGDFELSRVFARALAHRGVASLFVIMPYYGPRRQPDVPARMISLDPQQTVLGLTQAVLDIRWATAWLAGQTEVDAKQLGVFGISLGGITGGLAATAEPRLQKICLVLAGGDIGQIAWEDPHLETIRKKWLDGGGTKQSLMDLMKTVDPVTYGQNVRGRQILMLNALHDEVIPKACTDSLWQAFGQPKIGWYDAGHLTAALYIFDAISKVTDFFQPVVKK